MAKCCITGCEREGKKIGRLASIDLIYCSKHREYGQRILNFLINSRLQHRISNYFKELREGIFLDKQPKLSDESERAIKEYLDKNVEKLRNLKEESKDSDIDIE